MVIRSRVNAKILSFIMMLASLVAASSLHAHMMVAQQGTLNIVEDGVFMVLSLPISAFDNIDDDNDGKLSITEFSTHQKMLIKAVHQQVTLADETGKLPLEGMMLSPVASHAQPKAPVKQLLVMGRFKRTNSKSILHYQVSLFGQNPAEQKFMITATDKVRAKLQKIVLTPESNQTMLFQ